MTSVGINLSAVSFYSTEYPFLDRMRMASGWTSDGGPLSDAQLDANGYPIALPSGASRLYLTVGADPVALGTTDRYVITYTGNASNFYFDGANIVSQSAGRIVIEATRQIIQIGLTPASSGTMIGDFHMIREDQVGLFNQGEIFNPAFLAKADDWSTLRFMDWGSTNGSPITSWDQRTTPNQMTWTSWGAKSVPLEIEVALANKIHKDMWINIPADADDTFVRNTLIYVRDHLDAGLKVHVEYSNEMWNWNFPQTTWAQNQANAMWGVDANHDGHIDPNDNAERVGTGMEIWYGYRAAQVAAIGKDVFGASSDARLINTLATQGPYLGLENAIFQGVDRANTGTVAQLFDEYAITTYFGDHMSGGTASDRATILSWARGGEAGMAAAFAELAHGGALAYNLSLDALQPIYAYQKAVADRFGLDLVAYEGGMHVTAYQWPPELQNEVVDFLKRLQADPRMTALYGKMVDDFAAAGGSELTAFNDIGPTSVYGTWGLADDVYSTSNRNDVLAAYNLTDPNSTEVSTALGTYTLSGTNLRLTYTGTATFNGKGNALDNVLTGSATGTNTLDGGAGADRMVGGSANDIYYVDNNGDVIIDTGGYDEVRVTLPSYTLGDGLEKLVFLGTGNFAGTGNALANMIVGGPGDDVLDGGAGADTLAGGLGNDIYIVDNVGDVVTELAGQGNDEVRTTLTTYALPANVEKLSYIGTGGFTGTGNDLDNVIVGSTTMGNVLDGGAGADRMVGGSGNDIYYVDNSGDVIVDTGGIDEVRVSLTSYTLGDGLEKLTFIGSGNFSGSGNALANTITGGAGDDVLDGGAGADILIGGLGNDTYVVDNVDDQVVEAANAGIDTIRTSLASYTLGANIENLVAIGSGAFTGNGNELNNTITGLANGANKLFGGAGDDVLNGGAMADILDGGTGADRMVGGAGNDIYFVDNANDVVVEAANGGVDEIRSSISTYALPENVENLTFIGTGDFVGTGNWGDNTIAGGSGNDTLYGLVGDDMLIGGGGNDILDGGIGADRMIGGTGDDTYYVDNPSDLVIELTGQGDDLVISSINYTLAANVERLQLTGNNAVQGYGNGLDNTITGNDQANALMGYGGNDLIHGGLGNDYILGGDGNDTLYGDEGDDQLFGDDGNDTLYGGTGDDILTGGAGDDRLIGGAGNDRMTGGAGADTFVFAPGDLTNNASATDWVFDFSAVEHDKLDFTALRPTSSTAMSFLGTGAFTHHAGEVRYQASGASYDVSIDLNGDGVADLHLMVNSPAALASSDFLL